MKTVEKPFFTIVIPCYNSKKTITRLLNSIVAQNMSDEIQVVLSDDHSTESYDNEVRPFLDKLCIDRTVTDYNCCPGNTREKGTTIARGTWLLFADHDDTFLPNTFREVKKQITKNNEQYVLYCNIYRAKNTTGKFTEDLIEREMCSFTGLLHGKFFNRENFWNKYNIHFKKDLFTHEDTYVISVVKCIMDQLHIEPLHIDIFDYVWFNNSESLSNENGVRNFLEENFHCYVEATSDVYRDYYNKGLVSKDFALKQLIEMLLYEYFYMQMFFFCNPEHYIKSNIDICKKDLITTKRLFNLSNTDIFWYCAAGGAYLYTKVQREAGLGFIPNHSLIQWLNILNKD